MFTHQPLRIFRLIADIIFPPSDELLQIRNAHVQALAAHVQLQHIMHTDILLSFREPLVRACIHETKFHQNKKAMAMLAAILHTHLQNMPKHNTILMPIPLSRSRMRERGYNQVAEVAKIAFKDSSPVVLREDILKRTRHTRPQTDLPKEKRVQNVADAFGVRDKNAHIIEGAHIILLDDVLTTGATMETARRELQKYKPASVTCVALAH